MMRPMTRGRRPPGASLDLLPAAPSAPDLSWAAGSRTVLDAFARACAAIEAAGRRSAADEVRTLVAERLETWDGRPPGLSRSWADAAVSVLPAAERPAGRLALLTALASHQVDRSVIVDFRRLRPGDAALIGLTSWASLAAARRVGSRMWACLTSGRPG
jgi:hypothetical protein